MAADEDLQFWIKNSSKLQFLSTNEKELIGPRSIKKKARIPKHVQKDDAAAEGRSSKRKRSWLQREAVEERGFRDAVTWDSGGAGEGQELLPLKTERGLVPQKARPLPPPPPVPADVSEPSSSSSSVLEEETAEVPPSISMVELFALRSRKLIEKKELIALTSSKLMEGPEENISQLKTLVNLCFETDPDVAITIRKLAMVSFVEVVKDIAPGYQIRQQDSSTNLKLSKEVKKLKDFESSLLNGYQRYLNGLEEVITRVFPLHLKTLKGHSERKQLNMLNGSVVLSTDSMKSLAVVAVQCLCQLLTALSHFNWTLNILAVVVPLMDSPHAELSERACTAVETLFRNDPIGQVSLDAVKIIARTIKGRPFKANKKILETLLHLRFPDIGNHGNSEAPPSKRSKKAELRKMSRRDRKRYKMDQKVQSELKEAATEESLEKRRKAQTELLDQIFGVYFRILKQCPTSPLVTPVLAGLAKFSHLINVDFFSDLMQVLSGLLSTNALSFGDSLNCINTALQILSGQGESLNRDPREFYVRLYKAAIKLPHHSSQDIKASLECILKAFQKKKQVSLQRLLAFLKRLSTIALQLPPPELLATMATIRHLYLLHPSCDMLLDSDHSTGGQYRSDLDDPDLCQPKATTLWELSLLARHYHPAVRQFSKHLIAGAPSRGPWLLPNELSQISIEGFFKSFSSEEEDPFISLTPPTKAKGSRFKGRLKT